MGREEVLVAGVEAPSEVEEEEEEEEDEALALGARCRRLGSLRALGAVGSGSVSETGADNS